jgi:hypothetical protein
VGVAFPEFTEFVVTSMAELTERGGADLATALSGLGRENIRVLNLSIGGRSFEQINSAVFQPDVLKSLQNTGIFKAAGNSNRTSVEIFSQLDDVFQVAATNPFLTQANFSQASARYGIGSPGEKILSAAAGEVASDDRYLKLDSGADEGLLVFASGTSMASPMAAGAATLMLQLHPELTREEVYALLKISAFDWQPPNKAKRLPDYLRSTESDSELFDVYLRGLNVYAAYRILEETVGSIGKPEWKSEVTKAKAKLARVACGAPAPTTIDEGLRLFSLAPNECHSRRKFAQVMLAAKDNPRYGATLLALERLGSVNEGKQEVLLTDEDAIKQFVLFKQLVAKAAKESIDNSFKDEKFSNLGWVSDSLIVKALGLGEGLVEEYRKRIEATTNATLNEERRSFSGGNQTHELALALRTMYEQDDETKHSAIALRVTLADGWKKLSAENKAIFAHSLAIFPGVTPENETTWNEFIDQGLQ